MQHVLVILNDTAVMSTNDEERRFVGCILKVNEHNKKQHKPQRYQLIQAVCYLLCVITTFFCKYQMLHATITKRIDHAALDHMLFTHGRLLISLFLIPTNTNDNHQHTHPAHNYAMNSRVIVIYLF